MKPIGSFQFQVPTKLVFGVGSSASVGAEAQKLGDGPALVVADPGIVQAGLLDPILTSLQMAGIRAQLFSEVESNPRDVSVDAAGRLAREGRCALVVGVGGGSALDTAKGAALLATNMGSIREYDGTDKVKSRPLPVIAVPTTAGTGSEVTGNIAITHTGKHHKMSVRSPMSIPSVALLDPRLLRSLPARLAAAAGMDALSHAIEGYLSKRASAYTDMLALSAIELIGESICAFVADRAEEAAASRMLLASTQAGMVITHTGTGNDHAMARALGGMYDIHHGLACAVLLPPVMEFNLPAAETKMAAVAHALGAVQGETPKEEAARLAPAAVAGLCEKLGIPAGLGGLGMREPDIPALAEVALSNVGPNPRSTSLEDLIALFRKVLEEQRHACHPLGHLTRSPGSTI